MLIDWFTVGAQALNFIVLVWLMKHFFYKPVLDAIDAREQRIATELADADKKKADAQIDRDKLRHKNETFDQERTALLAKATTETETERQRLLDEARQAADTLSATRQQTMASDAKQLDQTLRQRAQAEVFAVARQALTDLATVDLEASACDVFITRLGALEASARDELANALTTSSDGALVRSAFELPTAQRTAMRKALQDIFAVEVDLNWQVAPELVGGIELSASGKKWAWSIADYLASLQLGVNEVLTPAAHPGKNAA